MAKRNSMRAADLKQVQVWYSRKFSWFNRCVYCGGPFECLDHVFPVCVSSRLDLKCERVRKHLAGGLVIVPSCQECNTLAADMPFVSVLEKRRWIKAALKKKYKGLLAMVVWDADDLDSLGHSLRSSVVSNMHKGYLLRLRLAWPETPRLVGWDGFLKLFSR